MPEIESMDLDLGSGENLDRFGAPYLKRSSQSFVEVKNRLMAADRRLDASLQ